jgi:tetratricopeptide (TPR) repeat protein
VHAAYSDDSEAAIFHALALAITAPKTDRTFSNQRKCGEILEPIFQRQPHHPGVAHYLIHCYDNPVLASEGLTAARAYAKIAPSSAHAQHMPSHIFTRLGLWDEAISSNLSSAASAAAAEQTSQNGEARDQRLHGMDYLEYAYLQSGRINQAKRVLEEMTSLSTFFGLTYVGNYSNAAVPARFAMERQDWKQAASLQADKKSLPYTQAITWMAIGVGSARTSDLDAAARAEQRLAELRDALAADKNTYWSKQVEVQRREVAGWIAQQSGKPEQALNTLREAAELEESMDKSPVTPGAIVPAREMLAELLALQHQPKDALAEYRAVLKTAPNRFNALYGAGTAADAAGESALAAQYFRKLNDIAVGEERPELAAARKKMIAAAR